MQIPKIKPIDTETVFTEFVRTFRGGMTVEEYLGKIPQNTLNADFVWPDENVIAELKCMSIDPEDDRNKRLERIGKSFGKLGYTAQDAYRILIKKEPVPQDLQDEFIRLEGRSIRDAIKKSNKQLEQTKILLDMPDAHTITFVANDIDMSTPLAVILKSIASTYNGLRNNNIEYLIYFTPNVFYELPDDPGTSTSLWFPLSLVTPSPIEDFMSELRDSWLLYYQKVFASYQTEPYYFFPAEGVEASQEILSANPKKLK